MDIETVRSLLEGISLTMTPFSVEQAENAARLWGNSKAFGLSLADRACLALAVQQKPPVVTAGRVWRKLQLDSNVRLLR